MKAAKKAIRGATKLTGLGGLMGNDLALGVVGTRAGKKAVEKLTAVPQMPQIAAEPAVEMPTPNDDAARAARRRRMLASQQRTGRQSTLLSNVDTLG